MYSAYITTIREIRKHNNADRLQIATVFGNDCIVDLSYKIGDKCVYFPVDGQLNEEFARKMKLLREKDANGKNIGGYLDPAKRNITAVRLRGEKSDGLLLKVDCLAEYTDVSKLADGTPITVLGGVEICKKYIPVRQGRSKGSSNKKHQQKEDKLVTFPQFIEHADTEQLAFNLNAFKPGDTCYITLKYHGSSGRTSNSLSVKKTKHPKLLKLLGFKEREIKSYEMVSGTRRTVLTDFKGGYYGDNAFREKWHNFFKDKLPVGFEVFYEVVGYVNESTPIMGEGKNKSLGADFVAKYGDKTVFNYGCAPGESDIYVYRMTCTTPDGELVEIPWEQVKRYCNQMGVKHVMEFEKFLFTDTDDLMRRVVQYFDGEDPIGKTHIREGVVVRIDNRPKFTAYKHKNFSFKVLSGIISEESINKVSADVIEEL